MDPVDGVSKGVRSTLVKRSGGGLLVLALKDGDRVRGGYSRVLGSAGSGLEMICHPWFLVWFRVWYRVRFQV
jgi:hypothetical protein